MSIAFTEEHRELARVARSLLDARGARAESRARLEAPSESLPEFWKDMAALGWLGRHVDEANGGQGFGLAELSIVLEALGYALAPGTFLPTTLASALLVQRGNETVSNAFLPGLADGSLVGAVGLHGELTLGADGRLSGSAGLVLYRTLPEYERRQALCESGYLVPHWPRPWGRDAGPVEQLVIEEEFAGVRRPDLSVSAWNTLTIAQHGNPDQLERFVAREVGAALADTESIVLMNLRSVIRAVEGSEPGAEASVTKLLGSELVQRKAAIMARLAGSAAAVRGRDERRVATWLMVSLGATIGGGTSEILRNQIGERLLGLPRDPLIQ